MLRLVDELFNADNIVPARTRIRYIRLLVQDNGPSYFQNCSNFITNFNCIFYFTLPLKHVSFAPVVVVLGSESDHTNTKLNRGGLGSFARLTVHAREGVACADQMLKWTKTGCERNCRRPKKWGVTEMFRNGRRCWRKCLGREKNYDK